MKKTMISLYNKEIAVLHNGDLLYATTNTIATELNCSVLKIQDVSRKLIIATVEYCDGWRVDVAIDVISTRKVRQ